MILLLASSVVPVMRNKNPHQLLETLKPYLSKFTGYKTKKHWSKMQGLNMFIKVKSTIVAAVYRRCQTGDTVTRGQSKINIQDRTGKEQNWNTATTPRNQTENQKMREQST